MTSNVSGGAGDMFLMVKGAKHGLIKGESQDDQHKGEIDVVSWSWGMQAKASIGGGTATGKATINDLRIVKRVDSASTALMLALRTNEPIQKAVLTLRKAGKGQLEYLKITIEQGRVISLIIDTVETSGSSGHPRESEFLVQQDRGRVRASREGRPAAGRHDVRGPME